MVHSTLSSVLLQDFKAHLRGALIGPNDEGYDNARSVWNGMIDRYPALIVRCAEASDVIQAIQFAQRQHLPVAVRGGGHSFAGNGTYDDGIVIDLSPMKRVQVDPVGRTAWVQAGATLGEYIRETQAFGLASPVGTASETGLAGLTLGGGLGWLMGTYGLAIDSLLAVDIVTADGRLLRASASEHADLFWGVRGGGGNFGIVTAFQFRLHPVGPLLAGMVVHPLERAKEVLNFYREFTRSAPDELTIGTGMATMPDGVLRTALVLCYCGPLEEGERLIEPLRTVGAPLVDAIHPVSYLELISMLDALVPRGRHYYSKACSLKHLDDEALKTIINYGSASPSPFAQVILQHVHGAVSRVDAGATAFALREQHHPLQIMTSWEEGTASAASVEWVRAFWKAMQPFAVEGTYINFLGSDEGPAPVRASYGTNYERLVALKNTYDPANFFHINHNIMPTAGQEGGNKQ
jgi:FAD/FMN-containing dehydrogenase